MMKKGVKNKLGWLNASLLATLVLISGGLAVFASILNDLPNPEQFENRQIIQSTKIYDRAKTTLLYELYGEEKRTTISPEEIPEYAKKATIAIEDKNFYTNPAFDWKGILRALIKNVSNRDLGQGGSTITQQLARNAFLSPEKTIIRKIKELIVAIELEKRYSKDEILNLYLNQIPYGGNAYGIQAAAQTFFGKSAKDLSLAEAALLASLPRATSYYSPWGKHLPELLDRKNLVLEKMGELGYITDKEKKNAQKTKLEFSLQTTNIKAPHFVLEVQDYLNKKYGEDFVRTAGLEVITTLDWSLQQTAEKSVQDGADRNTELYQGFNAALVAQNATSGQIMALVGSKNYFDPPEPENCVPGKNCHFEGNFDVAAQGRRQPGSAMKPFAYATAFQKGYSPDTMVFDLPTEFAANDPDCPLININFSNEAPASEGDRGPGQSVEKCFHPENFDEEFRGPVNLRTALAQSINIPAVKVLYLAGIDKVLKTALDFGITTLTERSRYGLSLVLGGGEVTLKELVGAYSVFAQEGIKRPQTLIIKITDSKGNTLEDYKDSGVRVMDSQYTRLINDILTDTDERSGLFSSSLYLTIFPGHQVALKTGTTNDYRDAWTIGYTPDLAVGVWAGNNDNIPMQKHGSSILAAVPIWSAFMKEALKNKPLVSFNKPDPVINQKPMFNKQYIAHYQIDNKSYPQVHDILFYIDKNDPSGPAPDRPENDSQFKNWEDPVLVWAEKNIPNFSQYNHPLPIEIRNSFGPAENQLSIGIIYPKNGDFIKNQNVSVQAQIQWQSGLNKIQLLFNNELVDEKIGNFGTSTIYQFNLSPKKIELQNSLKILAVDSFNKEIVEEVILYK